MLSAVCPDIAANKNKVTFMVHATIRLPPNTELQVKTIACRCQSHWQRTIFASGTLKTGDIRVTTLHAHTLTVQL
jgi:hypothetical protein